MKPDHELFVVLTREVNWENSSGRLMAKSAHTRVLSSNHSHMGPLSYCHSFHKVALSRTDLLNTVTKLNKLFTELCSCGRRIFLGLQSYYVCWNAPMTPLYRYYYYLHMNLYKQTKLFAKKNIYFFFLHNNNACFFCNVTKFHQYIYKDIPVKATVMQGCRKVWKSEDVSK